MRSYTRCASSRRPPGRIPRPGRVIAEVARAGCHERPHPIRWLGPPSLAVTWELRWLVRCCAWVIEVDRRERLSDPLPFLPVCAILGRLRGSVEPAFDRA